MAKFLDLDGLRLVSEQIRLRLDWKQDKLIGLPGQVAAVGPEGLYAVSINAGENVGLQQDDTSLTISTAVSHQNLLDNWYFVNPINQRGLKEYTNTGYTIDRWRITGAGSIKVQDDGLLIQKAPGATHITFETYIEDFRIPASETATVSAIVGGMLITATGEIASGISVSGIAGTTSDQIEVYSTKSLSGVHVTRLVIVSDEPYLLQAFKLERGSVQTLAHCDTSGNWVLNDPPPNPALELAKCQRYLQVLAYGGYDESHYGYGGFFDKRAFIFVPFQLKQPMRANPTLITQYMQVDKARIVGKSLSTYSPDLIRTLASMSVNASTKNQILLRCNPVNISAFPENYVFEVDALTCPAGEVLLASAEL